MRMGLGYDVHRLVEGRKLILGGVEIPWEKGLLGHSDADVLLHAVMDAMLGAAALGDIGLHFPDTDPAYKGVSSLKLLKKTGELLAENLCSSKILMQRSSRSSRKCGLILKKCGKISQGHFVWIWIKSISRPQQRKDLGLPETDREFRHRRSVRWRI